MKAKSLLFITIWMFIGLLGSFALQAEQTGNCTAGSQYCEQNS